MLTNPNPSERCSLRLFSLVNQLINELKEANDLEALNSLPSVMMTTGVLAVCESMGIEELIYRLELYKTRAKRGDFCSLKAVDNIQ